MLWSLDVFSQKRRRGGGVDQNTLLTCVKFSSNKKVTQFARHKLVHSFFLPLNNHLLNTIVYGSNLFMGIFSNISFFKDLFILSYVCVCCACMYEHAPWSCSILGGQKVAQGPQELELQMAVSLHVGAGNRTQIL